MSSFDDFDKHCLERKQCDIVKVDSVEFNTHKIILGGCSPYFSALFTRWSSEGKCHYIIPGISPAMMELIIQYASGSTLTDSVKVTSEKVEELLEAADQFNVTGVVKACCNYLEEQLSLENCIGIWRLMNIYYWPDLRHKAYLFILQHFEEMVSVSEDFQELSLHELVDIVQSDQLNVKQEAVVFETIVRWISYSITERIAHMSVLLPKVRLGTMNLMKVTICTWRSVSDLSILISALKATLIINSLTRPLPLPRLPHAILLAIGGWSGGRPTNGVEAYNPRAHCWVNVTTNMTTNMTPRAYHGAIFLKGSVYCAGGYDGSEYLNSAQKFNLATGTWHQVKPMHSCRCYVSVAMLDGCLYAMGGSDSAMLLNTAERYDPESDQWTQIASMHEHRSDASATTLHGEVYICGGINRNGHLSTAERYNPITNQWSRIAPMRRKRSGLAVCAYEELVYAVGGFDGTTRLRSAEAYDPRTDTWHSVPSMSTPRSHFGMEVLEDQLFAVGGFNRTFLPSVESYNRETGQWYNVSDMKISRSDLSCCVVRGLSNMSQYAAPR